MKVAALFSGGKDSTYAVHLVQQRGWDVSKLVSIVPEGKDSYMFHIPNIHLTPMLARALDIEHIEHGTRGEKESELDDLRDALAPLDVDGVVTGAIASDYQAARIDRICFELGIRSFNPLWRWDQEQVLNDMVGDGFEVLIVGAYADGLGKEWLGRTLDENAIRELRSISEKRGINVSGEGGELETLVVNGPNFHKRVEIVDSEVVWSGNGGELLVKDARLVEKDHF